MSGTCTHKVVRRAEEKLCTSSREGGLCLGVKPAFKNVMEGMMDTADERSCCPRVRALMSFSDTLTSPAD